LHLLSPPVPPLPLTPSSFSSIPPPPHPTLFPYTTLFRSPTPKSPVPAPGVPKVEPVADVAQPVVAPVADVAEPVVAPAVAAAARSEERRVGKECRSRGSPDH